MAGELVDAFGRASADESVAAVVVTGAGRAFCAGMDLSVDGNVFGLDESRRPTMAELRQRYDDPAYGVVTPAAGSRWRSTSAPSR